MEDDLGPLFRRVAEASDGAPASQAGSLAPRRRSNSWLGAVVVAVLSGVAIGALLTHPPVEAVPAERGVARPAPQKGLAIETWSPDQTGSLQLPVLAPPPAPGPAPRPRPGSGLLAEAAASRPPQLAQAAPAMAIAPRVAVPAPGSPPGLLSPPRAPAPAVEEPGLQRCADDDEECLGYDIAEADRQLAEAYRQAWQARVPASRLSAIQRSWRPGDGYATDDSARARLDAYEVRTRDVWALVDDWVRETDGR